MASGPNSDLDWAETTYLLLDRIDQLETDIVGWRNLGKEQRARYAQLEVDLAEWRNRAAEQLDLNVPLLARVSELEEGIRKHRSGVEPHYTTGPDAYLWTLLGGS